MINRDYYIEKIHSGFRHNPVVILLGARQVGKTTLMELFDSKKRAHWMIGQNPSIAELFERFETIERYLQININSNLSGLLIIDEFQYINKVSMQLKLLTDKYKKLKILCSGSSSIDILQKVEESLAGRARIVPVYSLHFNEYLAFKNNVLHNQLKGCSINDNINVLLPEISLLFNDYLIHGGLPKVSLAESDIEKEELLEDIYQTYLLKDVRQYIQQQDFVAFNKLLQLLAAQIGGLLNINELSRTIKLPYRVCEEYIYILEQMYIIHLVAPFTSNKRKEITKMKKIFFCDLGLRNVIYNSFNSMFIRVDNGQIFENYVYLQLLKLFKPRQIFYYRTKDGTEIDFIVKNSKGNIIPIEVKYKDFDRAIKVRAITEFMTNVHVDKAFIINKNFVGVNDNQYLIQPYLIDSMYT
jgi:hypothetical protein